MITGADAITQMRKLDELIKFLQDLDSWPYWNDGSVDAAYDIGIQLEQWRNEITKAGGIKPLESYTELLAPGDKL